MIGPARRRIAFWTGVVLLSWNALLWLIIVAIALGAMVNKGAELAKMLSPRKALALYQKVIASFGDSADPRLAAPVAWAMSNKAGILVELRRWEQAIAVSEEVVGRFGQVTDPVVVEAVEMALSAQDFAFRELGRTNEES